MSSEATRERLLDAAERLYADQGIDATSLRAITAAANANLAAVHYHFGSKEALTHAVLGRRIAPLSEERLAALDLLEAGAEPPPVRAILEAFLRPALELFLSGDEQARHFTRLIGRMHSEPDPGLQERIVEHFGDCIERFPNALAAAMPGVDRAVILWRMHFMIGSLAHTLASPALLQRFSGGACDPTNASAVLDQLLAFVSAGMEADPP